MGGKAFGGKRVTREEAAALYTQIRDDLGYSRDAGDVRNALGAGVGHYSTLCGSYRRGLPTCGDLDIVIVLSEGLSEKFDEWCLAKLGAQKSGKSARKGLIDGVQVEFYVASPANFGTQIQMWTGSHLENIRLRRAAKHMGYSLSQYGFKNKETGELVTCATEFEVYDFLGLEYKPPEER